MVRLLLEKDGVDANTKDKNGRTPLSWAAQKGHYAVVKLLLAKDGADPDSKDTKCGLTPLSWAAANGHGCVVKLLLDKSCVDVNTKRYELLDITIGAAEEENYAVVYDRSSSRCLLSSFSSPLVRPVRAEKESG
jgi:ankyrin repeat protein